MTINNRIRFFIGHFTLSLFIAFLALLLVFMFWYPSPLARAVGVTHLFIMMLAIDVIAGPILGFIVYKEGKKTLKMDLAIIILIQLSALSYGLYSIEKGRPTYIVYNIDRFELVRKNEIASNDHQHNENFGSYPSYVAVQYPSDPKLKEKLMFDEVFSGVSLSQRPEYYQDLSSVHPQIKHKMQPLRTLADFNAPEQVEKVIKKYSDASGFVPLKANHLDMTALLDQNAQVIKIVNLRPWK